MDVLKDGASPCPVRRLPAGDIENAVIGQLRVLPRAPEIIVRTWRAARKVDRTITEAEVRDAIEQLDTVWGELFPAEQARIVRLLVARVDDVGPAGLDIHLQTQGLTTLIGDLRAATGDTRRAA
jgi:hypothetical protein